MKKKQKKVKKVTSNQNNNQNHRFQKKSDFPTSKYKKNNLPEKKKIRGVKDTSDNSSRYNIYLRITIKG